MKRQLAAFKLRAGQQAKRIDALTLRERAIMFVSIAIGLVAAFDHFVLGPRLAEQKALGGQIRQISGELDGLRAQLAPGRIDGPGAKLTRDLDDLRAQQQQLDQALAQLQGGSAGGTQLPDLLERVLRRHERLTLLRLATVKGGVAVSAEPQRQAVQIAMRGNYPDLTQYLADTEAALPGLRWGDVAITRQGSSAELTATVLLNRSLQ
jgi:MSHA biogenesis protein MshJ